MSIAKQPCVQWSHALFKPNTVHFHAPVDTGISGAAMVVQYRGQVEAVVAFVAFLANNTMFGGKTF